MSDETEEPLQPEVLGELDPQLESIVIEQTLDVPLSTDERLSLGQEASQAQHEVRVLEAKKKEMTEEYKADITKFAQKVDECLRNLEVGKKQIPVQCRQVKDYRLGWLKVYRLDTTELVSERPLSVDERQMGMGFTGTN